MDEPDTPSCHSSGHPGSPGPPPPPLAPPHFEKAGYAPADEKDQTSLSLNMDIGDNYYLDLLYSWSIYFTSPVNH